MNKIFGAFVLILGSNLIEFPCHAQLNQKREDLSKEQQDERIEQLLKDPDISDGLKTKLIERVLKVKKKIDHKLERKHTRSQSNFESNHIN